MSASALLDRLHAAGIAVSVRGDYVVLNPKSLLTAELADAVRAAKPEIISLLTTWDQRHARNAIAATLQRIEARFPRDAGVGTTWDDGDLADLEAAVNEAAQAHDRAAFDEALRRYEAHVMERYCTPAKAEVAS